MKIKSIPLFLLFYFISKAGYAMEKRSLEEYRPGNIYEKIDISAYPKTTSAAECLQLSKALIDTEIGFWEDAKNQMLEENKKLKLIINILTQEKNKFNLDLRLRVLSKEEDSNIYYLFKSYECIIEDIREINKKFLSFDVSLLNKSSVSQKNNIWQSERDFIEESIQSLSLQIKKMQRNNLLRRGLMESSTLNKSQNQILEEQKNKFGVEQENGPLKYSLCDVEYTTDVFFPMLKQIFSLTRQFLLEKIEENKLTPLQKSQPPKITERKTKKRRKGKKTETFKVTAQTSTAKISGDTPPQELFPKDKETGIETDAKEPPLLLSSFPTSKEAPPLAPSRGEEGAHKDKALIHKMQELSVNEASVGKKEEEGQELLKGQEFPQEALIETGAEGVAGSIPAGEHPQEENLLPWQEYNKAKETLKKQRGKVKEKEEPIDAPVFRLSAEGSLTARTLLGWGGKLTSCQSVKMADYVNLIKELGGSVLDRKKCVHFMARSLINQEWRAVAMHRLHQDDPHLLPRNTPYWKIAQKLLNEIGLTEENLVAL